MSEPISFRRYSEAELKDARIAKIADPKPRRGLLYFATGSYWPRELERRAAAHARRAAAELRLADALRREQRRDASEGTD